MWHFLPYESNMNVAYKFDFDNIWFKTILDITSGVELGDLSDLVPSGLPLLLADCSYEDESKNHRPRLLVVLS